MRSRKREVASEACERLERSLSRKGYGLGGKARFMCEQYVERKVKITNATAEVNISVSELEKITK